MSPVAAYFILAFVAAAKAATLCTDANIELVARIVFGEARGEPALGQLAVAYSVVNRVAHPGYPNTVSAVVYQTYSGGLHQYNTLDDAHHNAAWNSAKAHNTVEYQHAKTAAGDALCGRKPDPTTCATDYCAHDPCLATSNNAYYEAYNKNHIGHHYFVCRRPVSG
ncbi:hypothetical protein CHS0354_008392 [Potamilus streckersoni]|uniref:Cell wall hydrolase SleB domain-containing protein n=1 Tax=Potamilus streckersoni TaxID=2493646 RepID=A0AAE0RPQ4_9BIVA|nr:hypothetical protein CHS0354_008392 [Potamilus streckersoni]